MASLFQEASRLPVYSMSNHWEGRFGLARLSLLRSVESRILIFVRLNHTCRVFRMLWSAISALFLSYYRLPTRPEWRERDPRLSLGSLGLGTESAVRFWVDFELLFLPFRRPLEPHGHSGNAKICGLVSKICKGSVSVMKTVKIAISECPWGSRGSPGGRKFENFEIF